MDAAPVRGLTHNFYRYPARFSPGFAAAVIERFSSPSDIVLDPYMGGGTSVVEGMVAGRHVVGNDLNSLATFITKVKTTELSVSELNAVRAWADREVPTLGYRVSSQSLAPYIDETKTKNLSLVRARFIKKVVAGALASIANLPSQNSRDMARCAVLRVGQWALDGRGKHTPLTEFRRKLSSTTCEMLESIVTASSRIRESRGKATLLNVDASEIHLTAPFRALDRRATLIVTSPPYPGVHVLYHRWQVDGRRESPAPYWIAGCNDGQGASFYNFGDRRRSASDNYFRASLRTLQSIRRVTKLGGHMVQMVAFNRPNEQLPRYLANMSAAGFEEVSVGPDGRIWRSVPNRKWHAALRGVTHSANEVVLVHRAI